MAMDLLIYPSPETTSGILFRSIFPVEREHSILLINQFLIGEIGLIILRYPLFPAISMVMVLRILLCMEGHDGIPFQYIYRKVMDHSRLRINQLLVKTGLMVDEYMLFPETLMVTDSPICSYIQTYRMDGALSLFISPMVMDHSRLRTYLLL